MEDGAPGHHSYLVSDFLDQEFDGKVVACDFLNWNPWAPGRGVVLPFFAHLAYHENGEKSIKA